MLVNLTKEQIASIAWLMEDKVSAGVMALPQFAGMRAALKLLQNYRDDVPCNVFEYDGSFKCITHNRTWGAISNPTGECEQHRQSETVVGTK